MPFKSKAQERYLYSQKPDVAKEFTAKTKDSKSLPDKVRAAKKKGYRLSESGTAKY